MYNNFYPDKFRSGQPDWFGLPEESLLFVWWLLYDLRLMNKDMDWLVQN